MPDAARPIVNGELPANLAISDRGNRPKHYYVHPRKRYKLSVLDAIAAMVRRKGDSPPCLIPGNSSQEEALHLTLGFNPFERLLANALSPAEQACVKYNCRTLSRVKRIRHRTIKLLEITSDKLRLDKIRLSNDLPVSAPARTLHIPIIRKLITDLDYTEKSLAEDLAMGMPIAGVIPRTSALPTKEADATMKLQDVRRAARTTNMMILNSISKYKDFRLKRK